MIGSFAFETHVSLVSFYARNVTFITCMRCVAISSITYEKLCKHLKAKSVFLCKAYLLGSSADSKVETMP